MKMIERIAIAMFESNGSAGSWALADHDDQAYWRDKALAALKAMREPTAQMCEAYLSLDYAEADAVNSYAGPIERFTAMIDAAIKEAEAG